MKKILLLLIITIASFKLLSQPSVQIVCGLNVGNDCFLTDPDVNRVYGFALTIDTLTSAKGWNVGSPKWERPNSGGAQIGGNNAALYTVKWTNLVNSPQKKVRLELPFVHDTLKDQNGNALTRILIDEKIVTIKYLAPISSLIFTGNVSQTNPALNGTITIPCNSGNITLTADQTIPVTDPMAGVTFTWTLPSGTQTSSTKTITFNGNGTTNGQITVVVKRNDGNFTQSFTVNYVRDYVGPPTIANVFGTLLCNNNNILFATSATNATTYQWATGGTFSLNGVGGTNNNLGGIKVNGSGSGSITVTANNACNVPNSASVNFNTGTPILTSVLVDGNPSSGFNYINNPALLQAIVSNQTSSLGFKWTQQGGIGSLYPNFGGSGVSFNGVTFDHNYSATAYAYDFMIAKVEAANECGVGGSQFVYLQDVSNMYRMASPNPAQNEIAVEFSRVAPQDMLKVMQLVSDGQARVVRTFTQGGNNDRNSQRAGNKVTMDVSGLPRGKYFLNLTFAGNKKFTEQIILN